VKGGWKCHDFLDEFGVLVHYRIMMAYFLLKETGKNPSSTEKGYLDVLRIAACSWDSIQVREDFGLHRPFLSPQVLPADLAKGGKTCRKNF